jgi:hypothetical protein
MLYRQSGEPAKTAALLEEALPVFRQGRPAGDPEVLRMLGVLSENLLAAGRAAEAERAARECLAAAATDPAGETTQLYARAFLAQALERQGRLTEAEQAAAEAYERSQLSGTGASAA